MKNLSNKISKRIFGGGKGRVFTNKDFFDLGNRVAVGRALSMLAKKAIIRRLRSGIYDYPKFNAKLGGQLSPGIYDVVYAWARKNNIRIMLSGAKAANQLGLSTQVPARVFLQTDGRSRKIEIRGWDITICHVSPKVMAIYGKKTEIVLRALIYIGEKYVDDKVIERLRRLLPDKVKQYLIKDAKGSMIG